MVEVEHLRCGVEEGERTDGMLPRILGAVVRFGHAEAYPDLGLDMSASRLP